MGGTFVFERFDLFGDRTPAADGEFVSVQEALDREAILQAEIRTLETQLKDARTALAGAAVIANASGAEITALRERIAGMEKACKPFVEAFERIHARSYNGAGEAFTAFLDGNTVTPTMTTGDFRRLRDAAIAKEKQG